jgi:type VI protein secretion system component VasF
MDPIAREIIRKHLNDMYAMRGAPNGDKNQRPLMAEIQFAIAEEQAKSAAKLERFTRWLVALTVALILLTAFLCYDAYTHHQSVDFSKQSTTK